MSLLLGLLGLAAAEPIGLEISAGPSWEVRDPFLRRRGAQLQLAWGPGETWRLGVQGAWYPDLGRRDWTRTTWHLVRQGEVSPDLSRVTARGEALLHLMPLQREGERLRSRVGLYGGFGVVRTHDDLGALQAVGDPRAEATEWQLHPTGMWGFSADLRGQGVVGLRLRAERTVFVEVVNSTTLEMKAHHWAMTELLLCF